MLQTKHEKKALVESTVVMAILIALMFITGLQYLDPPPPGNIAINFGTMDEGSGLIQPPEPAAAPKPKSPAQPRSKKRKPLLTSRHNKAPVIKSTKSSSPTHSSNSPAKSKKIKPQPSDEARKALNNLFKNHRSASEGDNKKSAGDQGNPKGDRTSNSRIGSAQGSGGIGGNYFLGNRKALTKPKPAYKCNETGRVVVIIKVNRQGKVVEAWQGRGTTASSCLTRAAIEAAYKTRWEPDPKAEPIQIGKIIYDFKLQ